MKGRYVGSVLFFKHIFLTVIILSIVIPNVLLICLRQKNQALLGQLSDLAAEPDPSPALCEEGAGEPRANDSVGPENVQLLSDRTVQALEFSWDQPSYESLYPELRVEPGQADLVESQTAYLTFDDGPTEKTAEILDILKDSGVKATFFVIGKNLRTQWQQDLLRRMVAEGHVVGIHTYSHDYGKIYASIPAFLEDFNQVFEAVTQITGQKPGLYRFPGGSINGYTGSFYQELIAELLRRGFVYDDWNVSGEDTVGSTTVNAITESVMSGLQGRSRAVILLHDSAAKSATVKALPRIISQITDLGYRFAALTPEIKPVIFGYTQPEE